MYSSVPSDPILDHRNPNNVAPSGNQVYPQPNSVYNQPSNYNQVPGYYVQPVYYAQPAPIMQVQQNLVYPQPAQPLHMTRLHKNGILFFGCLTIAEMILILIIFFVPWFGYCYWGFGLEEKHKYKQTNEDRGDNEENIADFYDALCPGNYFPECPQLCKSIKNVRYSGRIIYIFGSCSLALSVIVFILALIKMKKQSFKIPKYFLYALNCVPLALYLVGVIFYYKTSKFTEDFYNTKRIKDDLWANPNDFYWSVGLILSIVIMGVQFFKILTSKFSIGYLYFS